MEIKQLYLIIDENNYLLGADYGTINEVQKKINNNNWKIILSTIHNTPASKGDYYDGTKFVKEKIC